MRKEIGMVQTARDAESEKPSRQWQFVTARIDTLPDGPERDALLQEQDEIEFRLGELRRGDREAPFSPTP